jgi:nitrogen fixation protein NifU and related proteins
MYSQQVIDHFKNPRNQGRMNDADAIGEEGNPVCGDVMKIYLKIEKNEQGDDHIKDIKFETLGCAAAISVSSALTEAVKGLSLDKALAITKDDIVEELGGLPAPKIHCSMLGIDALRSAIIKYKTDNKI